MHFVMFICRILKKGGMLTSNAPSNNNNNKLADDTNNVLTNNFQTSLFLNVRGEKIQPAWWPIKRHPP